MRKDAGRIFERSGVRVRIIGGKYFFERLVNGTFRQLFSGSLPLHALTIGDLANFVEVYTADFGSELRDILQGRRRSASRGDVMCKYVDRIFEHSGLRVRMIEGRYYFFERLLQGVWQEIETGSLPLPDWGSKGDLASFVEGYTTYFGNEIRDLLEGRKSKPAGA